MISIIRLNYIGFMKKSYGIVLVLFSLINFLFSIDIVVQPYLQNATPNSMHILWETDADSPSRVEWGQNPFLDQ